MTKPVRIRVAVIPELLDNGFPTPCGYIRTVLPLQRMQALCPDIELRFIRPDSVGSTLADVFVWQRLALPSIASIEDLGNHARRIGAATVFDLDDDILALDSQHAESELYQNRQSLIRAAIDLADLVWTSTPELQKRIRALGPRCSVLPNRLDPRLWLAEPKAARTGDGIRFLYAGTSTHRYDLETIVEPAFSRLRDRFGSRVSLDVVGVADRPPADHLWSLVDRPNSTWCYPSFATWFQGLQGYHVGLAPLIDTPFNRAKSNIKWQEYTATGLATLASDLEPYRDGTEDGRTIALAGGDPIAFYEAMALLVDDPRRISKLRTAALGRIRRDNAGGDIEQAYATSLRSLAGIEA